MDRINSSGYIIVNGRRVFNDDPLAPTIIDAEWLNGVQEEICTAIEDTGMQLKRNIPLSAITISPAPCPKNSR